MKAMNELKCEVNYSMAYRAKQIALKIIKGNHKEQYAHLWDYGNELLRVMPNNTVKLELEDSEPNENWGRFKRMYICLEPLKKGFTAGCRPIIGLDGCHLKGPFGGQLLSAVGLDPNDGMYPICWAIVDVENTSNWNWFLSLLKSDLDIKNDGAWTFMLDKQKGLINAVQSLYPNSEHRHCVMHLCKNMAGIHKGIELRRLLCSAAKSTTDHHFDQNMAAIRKLNKKCYDWVMVKPKTQWSRSGFRFTCKSDIFVNNHCESGGPRFGVKTSIGGHELVVDLVNKECACRKWQLSGIPCFHAIACLNYMGNKLEDGIHPCYFRDMYLKVYNHLVEPINGQEAWKKTSKTMSLPPNIKVGPGRPGMKRKTTSDIPANPTKLKRQNTTLKYSNCTKSGHNSRSCPTNKHDVNINGGEHDNASQQPTKNEASHVHGSENQTVFSVHSSQPSSEPNDSQGGIFEKSIPESQASNNPAECGVASKFWTKRGQKVTTTNELLKDVTKKQKSLSKMSTI